MDARGRGRSGAVSVQDLFANTTWIRDVIEPEIARYGAQHLAADTVLELAAFLSKLLTHSEPSNGPSLAVFESRNDTSSSSPFSISYEDLQQSRIHRAVLLIAGRGTRWPGRLVSQADDLVELWTKKFGKLELIRPVLYEKGGRLYDMKEEKDLSRHALMVKWLSDRTSLVSPLRALEHGHLEFKPGQWWIHPIFAFHAGIIDSPDPQGGLVADSDGVYAIFLTGQDDLTGEKGEEFTYRIRKRDKYVFKLLSAILQPKPPIRVLRSHTLNSAWSPIAGLRYEGLYKVAGWSTGLDTDCRSIRHQVTLRRESDQLSYGETRKSPTSVDVDDYLEYRALRQARREKLREAPKRLPKHEKLLGVMPALQEREMTVVSEEFQDVDDSSVIRGTRAAARLGSTHPTPPRQKAAEEDEVTPSPSFVMDDYFAQQPSPLDGTIGYDLSMSLQTTTSEAKGSIAALSVSGISSPDAYSPIAEGFPHLTLEKEPHIESSHDCSMPTAHTYAHAVNLIELRRHRGASNDQLIDPLPPCSHASGTSDGAEDEFHQQTRKDSASVSAYRVSQLEETLLARVSGGGNRVTIKDHNSIHVLHRNIRMLQKTMIRRGYISRSFQLDLNAMGDLVERLEQEQSHLQGADQCLTALVRDMRSISRMDGIEVVRGNEESLPLRVSSVDNWQTHSLRRT